MEYLKITIVIALLAAFMLITAHKIGLIEKIQPYVYFRKIHEMLECMFCKCFWLCLLIAVVVSIILSDFRVIFTAVLATPITRKLI